MNGNNRLSRAGDYEAAGTTFTYRKREGAGCPGECVRAKGPVNQTVDVQVCTIGYVQRKSTTITMNELFNIYH